MNAVPQSPEEQAEADYGQHIIWRLVNSTILSFGANDANEILLTTKKDGVITEIIIGKDERGDVAIFETLPPQE